MAPPYAHDAGAACWRTAFIGFYKDRGVQASIRCVERHLRLTLTDSLERLPKPTFVRAWCAIAYLFPGLHPDGYECEDSGWPRVLRRFAAEAWRRADAGELTDNELYCHQPCKARLHRERAEIARVATWLLSDHFAA